MLYSKSLNYGSKPRLPALPLPGLSYGFGSGNGPLSGINKHSLLSRVPLCRMRQHPPAQSTGSRRRRPRQRRRRTTRLGLEEVNSKPSRRMEALKPPPHHPPQAPASRPAASPADLERVREARGYALASARGAGRVTGRTSARPRSSGALRVGVGVRARCGPRRCGLRRGARRRRPGAEGTRGRRAAGADASEQTRGPGGRAWLHCCAPAGLRPLPQSGAAAAPGDAR